MDEELLSRQQPQSLEAEQAVLGSILIDSRCITDVVGIVKPEDFYLQQNREIYEAIYTMFNFSQTIDPVTVLDKLKELGYYHDNSRDYILQLMEITPTAANVARYAAIVQEKSMLRGLNQAATDIQQMVSEEVGTPAEMLESAEKKIYALRKGERGDSLEHIGTTLHKVFDRLTELSQSDSLIPGLSTGLRDLDTRINGLNKSDLLLIAARPAMGKSAFALNIGVNVAKKYKKTVAIFNLEMSREQLAMRLLASEGFVELQKLATGKLSEDEWSKLCMASAALSQTDIRIDDNPSVTVADINAKCRRLDNLGLVIIDYLQLMQGSGYGKNSEPCYRGGRNFPLPENHGEGAGRAGDLPEPAVPCGGEPHRQAADPVRPPGIRRHRAGRRLGDVPVPGRILSRKYRGQGCGGVHRRQEPSRRNRRGEDAVDRPVPDLCRPGVETCGISSCG